MAVKNAKVNMDERVSSPYSNGGHFAPREPLYTPGVVPTAPPIRRKKSPDIEELEYHPSPKIRGITPQEIKVIISIMLVVTAIFMGIIVIAAERAVLQKEINDLNNQVVQIDEDISTIRVEIEQSKNIHSIVAIARDELNMSEPSHDQQIFINELNSVEGSFIDYIREKNNAAAAAKAESEAANSDMAEDGESYDDEYSEDSYVDEDYGDYEDESYEEETYED